MTTNAKKINKLWDDFTTIIAKAYESAPSEDRAGHNVQGALSDYVAGYGNRAKLANLVDTETKHERRHRAARHWSISAEQGARLIIMQCACDGADRKTMPPATIFLTYRDSAAESTLLGFLCSIVMPEDFKQAVRAIDYTKLHSELK